LITIFINVQQNKHVSGVLKITAFLNAWWIDQTPSVPIAMEIMELPRDNAQYT
jgi:hypothetical protein